MKYGDLTLGQVEAVVNRLGGMSGVSRFLEFLKLVCEVAVGGTKKFVAADAFGANNPAGIKFFLGDNFEKHLLGKIENDVEPATIVVHRLEKPSRDPDIMAELGEKQVIKLAHFYELIKAQASGQEGPLLVNGFANIAYIENEGGNLWTVRSHWHSFSREWFVDAYSVEFPDVWCVGRQVLSRK